MPFRFPTVRRRTYETEDAYRARRAQTRQEALRLYRLRIERLRSEAIQRAPQAPQPQVNEISFDSFGALLTRAEGPQSEPQRSRRSRSMDSWAGTDTWEEAVQLARHGWPDGAEQLSSLTATLTGRLANVAQTKRLAFDVMGPGTLDVGRWAIGHPECMQVWAPSEDLTELNPSRILRILVNGTVNNQVPHHQMFWRGAAAFAICDLAETSGTRCEVELVYSVSDIGSGRSRQRVMLKRAQDPIDPDGLAFALCHPSSLRRVAFGAQETLPAAERERFGFGSGIYGYPVDLDREAIGDAIYIPANGDGFDTADETAEWVVKTLRAHEIEVEPM